MSALFCCFYSFISQVCHCWCPPFSVGHIAFLFICFPGFSLPVSALFRWSCNISMRLPGLSLLVSALFRWPCNISIHLPGLSLLVSAIVRWSCNISIHMCPRSVTGVSLCIGHEAFLFIYLPDPSLLVPCNISIHLSVGSALVRWP